MKIKLVKNVRDTIINGYPGKTFAEKRQCYEGWGEVPKSRFDYENKLAKFAGKWMEVDTKWLFEHSFNGIMDDGTLIDVQQNFVDEVDISPEFKTLDEWIEAVQTRYDRDWPGSNVREKMIATYQNRLWIRQ